MENKDRAQSDSGYKNLRIYNLLMGFLHLVQGIVMLVLSNDFSVPISTSYLNFDAVRQTIAPVTETIYNVRIGPLVAAFLFMSSLAHFLLTLPGIYKWYINNLKRHINFARWYEYSLSSSLMIVVIAMLSGMFDLGSLILIFALNATMILFGYLMELHNQTTKITDWTAFVFGCFAGIVPWIVIGMYFLGAIADYRDTIPKFVYFILISLFIFFNIFAVNMVLQYKKVGKWRDYLFGEKVYILLSLLAKSALAWQVFSGTLRPE